MTDDTTAKTNGHPTLRENLYDFSLKTYICLQQAWECPVLKIKATLILKSGMILRSFLVEKC